MKPPVVRPNLSFHLLLSCGAALVVFGATPAKADEPKAEQPTRFAADRPVDCVHIKLELTVDVENEHVDGSARLDLVALRETSTITLDADNFEVSEVTLSRDGSKPAPVKFINDGQHIEVMPDKPFKTGEQVQLTIEYAIDHPESGLHFFGPSENEPDVPYIVWSQGESVGNSHWFPCFNHPNERQTTEMIVTTKRGRAAAQTESAPAKSGRPTKKRKERFFSF